ncbi:hypothetical protein X801_01208 [Opisthorchis viverrini]|uniref:Uncharacterized protein n=1 Tax=Opisthorchis viverrini TaxID=6198 RepID=A0A1S8X863_OPIVI|nr:hypothetical protein X801_01208 [Opisthorchis viverrini]
MSYPDTRTRLPVVLPMLVLRGYAREVTVSEEDLQYSQETRYVLLIALSCKEKRKCDRCQIAFAQAVILYSHVYQQE